MIKHLAVAQTPLVARDISRNSFLLILPDRDLLSFAPVVAHRRWQSIGFKHTPLFGNRIASWCS
jgi:hypothetical protein